MRPLEVPVRPVLLALSAVACTPHLTSPDGGAAALGDYVAPENSWPIGDPVPASLAPTGWRKGETPDDFRLMDQYGDTVSLWQFYGMVVVVDISTGWCGPCRSLAKQVDDVWHDYEDQGFMYLTMMPENKVGDVPSLEDLQDWASDGSITAPVLQDDQGYSAAIVPDSAYPRILVVDREMVVAVDQVVPAEDTSIRAAIEAEL